MTKEKLLHTESGSSRLLCINCAHTVYWVRISCVHSKNKNTVIRAVQVVRVSLVIISPKSETYVQPHINKNNCKVIRIGENRLSISFWNLYGIHINPRKVYNRKHAKLWVDLFHGLDHFLSLLICLAGLFIVDHDRCRLWGSSPDESTSCMVRSMVTWWVIVLYVSLLILEFISMSCIMLNNSFGGKWLDGENFKRLK